MLVGGLAARGRGVVTTGGGALEGVVGPLVPKVLEGWEKNPAAVSSGMGFAGTVFAGAGFAGTGLVGGGLLKGTVGVGWSRREFEGGLAG